MTAPIESALKTTQVYTNTLWLEPEEGMSRVVDELGAWITWKTSELLTGEMILSGKESYTFKDESELLVELGQFEGVESSIPMLLKASYVHDDFKVEGRQWITEVTIKRELNDFIVQLVVNLFVVDTNHDARPPSPSRPRLMVNITESCRPIGSTPGLYIKPLSTALGEKFLSEIHNHTRQAPIVLVSSHVAADSAVNVERMREQLLGLANLYQVTEDTDGWELANILGKEYSCYGDAIRIIWPIEDGRADPSTMLILSKDKHGEPRTFAQMERIATILVLCKQVSRLKG